VPDKTSWVYTEKVKQHFMNPKNILQVSEEEYNADADGMVGSPACGDMMKVYLKITDNKIIDFKWKTFGCASAIASTSALSELIMKNGGMSLDKAYTITPEDIITELGGLPANKIHCSVLGDKALQAAIDSYFEKNKMVNPYKKAESEIICDCKNISREDIRMEVLEGAEDFAALQKRTEISTVCGKCREKAESVFNEYRKKYYSEEIYKPVE